MSSKLSESSLAEYTEIESTYNYEYEIFDINNQQLITIIGNINKYLDLIKEFLDQRKYNMLNRKYNDECLEVFFNLNTETKLPKSKIFEEYINILKIQLQQFNEILKLSTYDYITRSFKMVELIYNKIKALYTSDNLKYQDLYSQIVNFKDEITKITQCTNHYRVNINEPINYIIYYMSKDKFDDEHDLEQFKKLYKMTPISLTPDKFDKPQILDMDSHNKYVSATAADISNLHVSNIHINNWILLYNKLYPDDIITDTITNINNNIDKIFPIYQKIILKVNNFILNNFIFMKDHYTDMLCFTPEMYKKVLETYNDLLTYVNKIITNDELLEEDRNDLLRIIDNILQVYDKKKQFSPRRALDYLKQFDEDSIDDQLKHSISKLVNSVEKQIDGGYNLNNKYKLFYNKYFN